MPVMASFEHDSTEDTGIKDLTPRGNSEVTRARERKAHAALDMALEGYSWTDIAEILGFPTGRAAQVATEQALEQSLLTETSQRHMRKLFERRYERLLKAFWKTAIDTESPDRFAAAKTVREILFDARRLMGLDAPQQYVVATPSSAELEAWVAKVQKHEMPALKEADIFADDEPDVVPGETVSQDA
jgi:hypothetical protein